MQKSCKIKHLDDCLRFQIVKIALLKFHLEMCKRIQLLWEINFHLLVRIWILLMEEIRSKENTMDMRLSKRAVSK